MSNKNKIRRAMEIRFKDGSTKTLEISNAVQLHVDSGMMHLDKMKDDTFRLIFSEDLVKDFSQIESFVMIRED